MRIATWNINSVRRRLDHVTALLTRHDIDVLCLQETKCKDDQFPYLAFEELGYQVAHVGYSQWNGVAIISRVGLEDVAHQFPGQPGFAKDPDAEQSVEARAVGATCGGVRVWSLYVPNGRELHDRHYGYKLRWLAGLSHYVERDVAEKTIFMGDFNVAPRDEDVWDVSYFVGRTHLSEPERAAFEDLQAAGLVEVTRPLQPEAYSYFDYQAGRWPKGEGMRIDFQLATPDLVATDVLFDLEERATEGTSDHVPVIVDYAIDAIVPAPAAPAVDSFAAPAEKSAVESVLPGTRA